MDFITSNWLQFLKIALGINLAAFLLFGLDKFYSTIGGWRIPERTLLGLALIGGSLGVFAARTLFRHKTRKQPFNTDLKIIVLFQVVILICLVAYVTFASVGLL